jgi:hypothetical protein
MFDVPLPRAAAWAPFLGGERSWLIEREATAVAWLLQQAASEGSRPVVQGVSHAHSYRDGDGPLAALAKRGDVSTYKSPVGPGATFVHNADIRLLATGMSTAGGFSLVATETKTLPLHGWAMATRAVDLATNEVIRDERSTDQIEMLEGLVDQLYNGWSHREVGRRASAYYMPRLADSGMSYAVFVGSLIALAPRHLDSNSDIEAMKKALPPAWASEREALSRSWL